LSSIDLSTKGGIVKDGGGEVNAAAATAKMALMSTIVGPASQQTEDELQPDLPN